MIISDNSRNPIEQINSAISQINDAKTKPCLEKARNQANAFIKAAYDKEEITLSQKYTFSKKVRSAYRSQLGA
ncbi:hypothetical protein GWP85_11110 [Acinetobacter beijerinckii]|uniref:hypothetical protein n=1 Tax=Acinetobacter beijerinckii TaxID=262668 RepID=UPI0023DDBD32|nr:hypothetical protein [Acinetobacter beijerinckii]MDF2418051.1 hypothetical protein [Acinetobacter beijerinckii]